MASLSFLHPRRRPTHLHQGGGREGGWKERKFCEGEEAAALLFSPQAANTSWRAWKIPGVFQERRRGSSPKSFESFEPRAGFLRPSCTLRGGGRRQSSMQNQGRIIMDAPGSPALLHFFSALQFATGGLVMTLPCVFWT